MSGVPEQVEGSLPGKYEIKEEEIDHFSIDFPQGNHSVDVAVKYEEDNSLPSTRQGLAEEARNQQDQSTHVAQQGSIRDRHSRKRKTKVLFIKGGSSAAVVAKALAKAVANGRRKDQWFCSPDHYHRIHVGKNILNCNHCGKLSLLL